MIDKVREYCIDDVKITKELYDYAKTYNKLLFKEAGVLKEIPLDASEWEMGDGGKLTFTMPF